LALALLLRIYELVPSWLVGAGTNAGVIVSITGTVLLLLRDGEAERPMRERVRAPCSYVMIDSEFDGLGGSRDGRRGGGGSGGGGIGGGREGSGGMRRAGGDNRGGADEIRAVEATLAMQMPHTGRAWESSERERQRRSESSEVTDLTHSMAMMGSSPPPQFFMRTEGDGVFPTYSCSAPSAREWQSPGSGGGGAGVMGGELYPGGLGLGRVPPQSSAPPQPIFSPAEAVGLPRTAAAAEAAPADTIEHAGALRCCATLLEQLSATHGDAGRLQV
jgi:hypothetical protein